MRSGKTTSGRAGAAVLWERGQSLATLAYVLGSVVVSIGALVAGLAVVRTLVIPATA